jgi:ferric-dicitrate binding protein FerR (iron transport regulator)
VAFIETSPRSWQSITNHTGLSASYTLPDSSTVILEPNSSLKLSSEFNKLIREVQLEGEGFFEVTPSAEKPFLVYTQGVTTKVLGTSFTIRSYHDDTKVSVAVRTGKVSVYAKPSPSARSEEIILTPNQEIIFDKAEKVVAKRIVEKPEPIIPAEEIERMRFEDAPIKEVFEAIERVYGVEIQYDEGQFAFCTITTTVSGGGLYDRLDIITRTIGARYEQDENRIIVSGDGCN